MLLQVRPPREGLQADLVRDGQSLGQALALSQRKRFLQEGTGSYATLPALALLLPLGQKLLNVFWVKPGEKVGTQDNPGGRARCVGLFHLLTCLERVFLLACSLLQKGQVCSFFWKGASPLCFFLWKVRLDLVE